METMKKITYTLAAIFASAFALTSCTKEMTDSSKDIESQGIPFEICASVSQTRTTTDNSWNTTWVARDAINLFHAEAGTTTYVSDGQFTVENTESGKFKGNLARELTADSYDWYAFYPYSSYNKTPAGDAQSNFGYTTIGGTSQTQTGNNSQAHLCGKPCPLYGVVKSVSKSSSPNISMQQLVSVIEVNVTNNSGEDLTVSSVSFTGTEDIVGTFYINFTGTPIYTIKDASSVSETASLTVSEGAAIANGASAKFYLAIKPFTAASGSNIKLSVNGYEKTKKLTSDVTFAAGKIKKFSFDFDKATEKIIYSTEFNYSVVTTNGQTLYTNSDEYIGQDDGKTTSWGILYGNWNGSNCGQMRVYSAGNFGSLYMKFDVSKATKISYKAKVDNTKLKLNTYYSTDSGKNWIKVDADKVLTTTLSEYSFTISETGEYDKNRVKFEVTGTAPSSKNYQLTIDDVTIFGDGEVVEPKLTKLATPSTLIAGLSSSSPNSIEVVWEAVENAGSYVVTATPSTGSAVVKEVTTASHTFIGLEYNTEYTISVYAKSSDPSVYSDSDVATYDDTITTGAKPESGGETKYFVKVTSAPADWSGEYLIVCEDQNVAFDGSLETLDVASNNVSVTITDNRIEANDNLLNSTFTINAEGTTIQSKSGYYIGQSSNANGLKSSTSTSYAHTLSFTDSGEFTAVSGGAYLRYNSTSGQTRFRYFKSSTYTRQKAIQLYKLEN